MIFSKTCLIETSHTSTSPGHFELKISKGLVYKIEIDFPKGCNDLVYIAIFDGGGQVWPSTPGEWFHTNNYVISFDDLYFKMAEPAQFDIYGYGDSCTYDHNIKVRIGLVSARVFMARFLPSYSYRYFVEALKELEEEAETRRAESLSKQVFSWLKRPEE